MQYVFYFYDNHPRYPSNLVSNLRQDCPRLLLQPHHPNHLYYSSPSPAQRGSNWSAMLAGFVEGQPEASTWEHVTQHAS